MFDFPHINMWKLLDFKETLHISLIVCVIYMYVGTITALKHLNQTVYWLNKLVIDNCHYFSCIFFVGPLPWMDATHPSIHPWR